MDEGNPIGYEAILWGSLAALDRCEAALQAKLADVQAVRGATLKLLHGHGDGALSGRRPVTVEELNGCSSQREGLKMIAERSGGRIKLGEAVRLIHESELTSAKLPSLRTALHRYVNGSPEWTAEGRGFYRLSGFSGSDQNALEGAFTVHEPGGVYTEKRFRVDPGKDPVVDDIEDGEDRS